MSNNSLIRIGSVSSIDYENGRVKVLFKDKDNTVSDFLPMLSSEYFMPKINDLVVCLFINGTQKGFCLGKYFSKSNIPVESGNGVYYKDLFGEGFIKYDKVSKALTINVQDIIIIGDLAITGDLYVDGNISATGTIEGRNIH